MSNWNKSTRFDENNEASYVIKRALDSYDPFYKDKIIVINSKLKENVVLNAWHRVRKNELSLRKMARELNVNHESLRQRFVKLDRVA